ncbi:MAG: hypothetical protein GY814_17555 [Gammaproteobacteria bacterium]|nr:hypothetical protein [Gammaproteobacteria bacterium]
MRRSAIASKRMVSALLTLAVFFVVSSQASALSTQEAINKSGKQRMLTQRMLKDYALVGMGVNFGDPKTDLKNIVAQFDTTVGELKATATSEKVTASLNSISQLWGPIKQVLTVEPQQKSAAGLQRALDDLLQACHQATVLITESADSKAGEIINISGRQRMLSQRLAGLYMLRVWGVKDSEFEQKLAQVMDEFRTAHQALLNAPATTLKIKKLLGEVNGPFSMFELMAQSKSGKFIPALISKSSDKIVIKMDEVTGLYTGLK